MDKEEKPRDQIPGQPEQGLSLSAPRGQGTPGPEEQAHMACATGRPGGALTASPPPVPGHLPLLFPGAQTSRLPLTWPNYQEHRRGFRTPGLGRAGK